jgi:glutamate-1-semialdehyde aminotransferase
MPADDPIRLTELYWSRLERVLAAGRWTPTQGVLRHAGGAYPLLAQRGLGARLWDTSGREYIDWMMGWGPVVLGYRHPAVEAAIAAQLAEGPLFSLTHPLEIEVGERVQAMVPCADGVAFGKNGSDVLALAVRIARAHTGRELVLHYGYHGFHDWFMAGVPQCEGMPAALRATIQRFPYGDLAALGALLDAHAGRVAALVMEPTNEIMPPPGYLAGVAELARRHGALLVFDEVVTGFRLARGGAQEAFGVEPDLACVGKALANGMPLSALCGRAEFLYTLPRVGYGLTYRGETLSLAAARAALDVIASEPVCEHLARVGEALRAGFAERARRAGVPAELIGPPARLSISLGPAGRLSALAQTSLILQEMLKRGVLSHGVLLPSYAHGEEEIACTLDAFEAGLTALARARDRDSLAGLLEVPGVAITYGDEEQLAC